MTSSSGGALPPSGFFFLPFPGMGSQMLHPKQQQRRPQAGAMQERGEGHAGLNYGRRGEAQTPAAERLGSPPASPLAGEI